MLKAVLLPLLLAGALTLGGCATADLALLEDLGQRVGVDPDEAVEKAEKVESATLGNAVKALPVYCRVPRTAREILRERVNDRPEAEGASIYVHCPGDPAFTVP